MRLLVCGGAGFIGSTFVRIEQLRALSERFHCLDPEVGIEWPSTEVFLSPADGQAPTLAGLSLGRET